jgi:hypothetical protein
LESSESQIEGVEIYGIGIQEHPVGSVFYNFRKDVFIYVTTGTNSFETLKIYFFDWIYYCKIP